MKAIKGMLSPLITAFDAQGNLNTQAMQKLARFQMDAGMQGFYTTGSTGEGLLMTTSERKEALEAVIDEVKGAVPVMAHVGAIATREAAELTAHAAKAGADAVASIPPIYYSVDLAGLKAHYRAVADAANGLPVWIYNVPGSSKVTITADIMKELFDIKEIVGIKYTSYDFFEMRAIIELGQERGLTVLSGPDEMCLPAQVMGAQGAIGTTFNLMPGLYMKMYNAWRGGNMTTAQECQYAINRVIRALFSGPILGSVKEVLRAMGFDCGTTRLPLRPLTDAEKQTLWQKLTAARFAELADVPVHA